MIMDNQLQTILEHFHALTDLPVRWMIGEETVLRLDAEVFSVAYDKDVRDQLLNSGENICYQITPESLVYGFIRLQEPEHHGYIMVGPTILSGDRHLEVVRLGEAFHRATTEALWDYVNSLKVSGLATVLTLIIGVPLAYFYQMYEIKGKTVLQVLIILCSMSAPFIGAYSWIMLLGRGGIITQFIESITKTRMPSIYGFNGILLVLALQLFPLVFLYVSGALKNIDNSLLEASENMGCSGFKRFFTIVIPLCMPTIIAATLMVFMRAFADFGTPLLIGEGYQTFPVIIYKTYFAETGSDHNFGAAISVIAIMITAVIFLIQRYVNNQFRFTMNAMHSIERKELHGVKSVLVHFYCWFVVLLAFMPQVYVIYTSFQKTSGKIFLPGYSLDSYRYAFTHLKNGCVYRVVSEDAAAKAVHRRRARPRCRRMALAR